MKKNGFIATSLIYSFFLIFITLFLTIIVDYIQNKINLEYQESSVKAKLNNVVTAKDFNPGDYVLFDSDCDGTTENIGEEYIVASKYYNKTTECQSAVSVDCVILYSYDLTTSSTNAVTTQDINTHINIYDRTATDLNEILYTFNTCGNIAKHSSQGCAASDGTINSYNLRASGTYSATYPTLNANPASVTEDLANFTTKKGTLSTTFTNWYYRTKKILVFDTGSKKNRKTCKGSSKGTYYLEQTVSAG